MATSLGEVSAKVDMQHMQIEDIATQIDTVNNLMSGINVSSLRQEIIDTFKRAQDRISALEAKVVLLDTEMDKTQATVKEKKEGGLSLVDSKMVPETIGDYEKHNFRQWARKVRAYCGGRRRGFREALQWAE